MTAMAVSPFPNRVWGSSTSPLSRAGIAFSCTRIGSATIRALTPLDRRIMTRTRGKYTVLGPIGAPTLLLTTTGRKSGQPRTSPLLYGRDGDDALIVVGSNFGQEHHPAWTANLIADPDATVTMGGKDIAVHAELLQGEDAERAFGILADVARTYTEYRSRTDRELRVFRLTAR